MTDLQTFIINIIGELPAGLDFFLPIFCFFILLIGLILITLILMSFIKGARG